MNCLLVLIVFFLAQPFPAECGCGVLMPYSSMTYLDQTQLTRYGLTDPCTVTCTAGYTGDFCQDKTSFYRSLPMGPWNQAGYYTLGRGLLKTQSISVNSIDYIQFTKKDSTLVGIFNAMYSGSSVVEINLYSRAITPVMTPSAGSSFDCLLVRNGIVYVARTIQIPVTATTSMNVYDVVHVTETYQVAKSLAQPSARVSLMEVFVDKGMVTTLVYLSTVKTINACYPDGTCSKWATLDINGMACGVDCPSAVFASAGSKIMRITSVGAITQLSETGSTIYCLTGLSKLNLLLYKSISTIYQHNILTQTSSSIPLGVADSGIKKICSLDVSELNNQILIVQDGVIRTLEAVQQLCGYGLTSQALLSNSKESCFPCSAPPENAYWIEGSALCEWKCNLQFLQVGSRCVSQAVMPCTAYYVTDLLNTGLCTPSLIPWVDQGSYVESVLYSNPKTLQGKVSPYPTTAIGKSVLIEVSMGAFYVSVNEGTSWSDINFASFTQQPCPWSSFNQYYYLSSNGNGYMWVAFYYSNPSRHCLWFVDATEATLTQGSQLKVIQSWSLGSRLCSATGDHFNTYVLLCGAHFLSYAQVKSGSTLQHLAGGIQAGYLDGTLKNSKFNAPSSVVLNDHRLYVSDTGNCVIRELDLLRDATKTVAGNPDVCQRIDSGLMKAALVFPTNLTYTPFPGFFIFVDKYTNEENSVIRQFHVLSYTVQTIYVMPSNYFNEIISVGNKIMIRIERNYQFLQANAALCPAGSSSLTGGALTVGGCISCGSGFYSDAFAGACKNCSMIVCDQPGKMLVPCELDADAYCGQCTNKPVGDTVYTGPSSITGTSSGGGDCLWAYTPPCPRGYYASNGLCVNCPAWSTTPSAGSTLLSQCMCLGNGVWTDGVCVVPASLVLFPLLPSCSDYTIDSPDGICPCEPGEYIQQINPKICTPCQPGSYSAAGTACVSCPERTEPSMDRSTCRCAGGLHDASDVTSKTPQCECGPGKAFLRTPLMCKNCAENTFNAAVVDSLSADTLSTCQSCAPGTFSGSGASVCAQCPFGTYRVANSPFGCQSCLIGMYASDPTYDSCVTCSETCENGAKESPCPTDPDRFICSECAETIRANSHLNGARDCATSCNTGYFERDNECVRCADFDQFSCTNGSLHVRCGLYSDAACVPCVNDSMPLNYAVWKYSPLLAGGPNAVCEWTCEPGYVPTQTPLPGGVPSAWECVLAGAFNAWDLFTI